MDDVYIIWPAALFLAKLRRSIANVEPLRQRLGEVTCISICGESFAGEVTARISGADPWIQALLPNGWRQAAFAALPRLEDLRIEGDDATRRYRRSESAVWSEWYTGLQVRCFY
ncbi:hypothetical protein LTR78_004535 [Recurvomyces mirabilis]|uniref:Uncharacterized protein n=1 Tax=Recurvomyces mirabilis TaxID=574656 RepID=A0AAE0WPC3_9PEZI|nr:hypothetical protein LTR78_004535 [Recurvomyces mirabilis]KAK5152971.1 hypothetical protein LTS14_008079 [Recurvomyces mirabilis]